MVECFDEGMGLIGWVVGCCEEGDVCGVGMRGGILCGMGWD